MVSIRRTQGAWRRGPKTQRNPNEAERGVGGMVSVRALFTIARRGGFGTVWNFPFRRRGCGPGPVGWMGFCRWGKVEFVVLELNKGPLGTCRVRALTTNTASCCQKKKRSSPPPPHRHEQPQPHRSIPMAAEAPPCRYRRIRKSSDLSAVSAAAPSKRVLPRQSPPSSCPRPRFACLQLCVRRSCMMF
jgi:hypothetical protein